MVTAALIIWAVIGPSIGLVCGAWWCSRVRDEPVEVRQAQPRRAVPPAERSLGWR